MLHDGNFAWHLAQLHCSKYTSHMSSSSSTLSSDGSSGAALTVRVRPLEYHHVAWAREVLRARDFRAAVLHPTLQGILGSSREGSRLLLFLEETSIISLASLSRESARCLRYHLHVGS